MNNNVCRIFVSQHQHVNREKGIACNAHNCCIIRMSVTVSLLFCYHGKYFAFSIAALLAIFVFAIQFSRSPALFFCKRESRLYRKRVTFYCVMSMACYILSWQKVKIILPFCWNDQREVATEHENVHSFFFITFFLPFLLAALHLGERFLLFNGIVRSKINNQQQYKIK